ncbi:helix-turn-helix transcriptional regulator [Pseudalkalibacillus sp. A8]|uniref:helix-turn-helix transcriptional regulator n=1 Tax=Pseudalkalibacillus sp. A8 TaxID=3382641 RepID=UPI0038B5518C
MNKSQRLIEILMTINSRKKFTIRELTEQFQVSKRTILRDLQELSELGVPLYSEFGIHGGYRLLNDCMLPPIYFTEKEAAALFFVSESLRNYRHLPFETQIETALKKFYHYLPPDSKAQIDRLRSKILFFVPARQLETPFLAELLEASINQHIVTVTYESENGKSKRDIQCIGVYTMNGFWYCSAYCFKSQQYRVFRVDRVQSLASAKDQSKKMDMEHFQIKDWVHLDDGEQELKLNILLTQRGVLKCKSDMWLSEGLITHQDGSGKIQRKMAFSYVPWVVQYMIGCGSDAIVKEPVIVRELIMKQIEEIQRVYVKEGEIVETEKHR